MTAVNAEVCAEFAPAKVNLTLEVGQVRADGYHPLDSLVVFADWGDQIEVRDGSTLSLSLEGEAAAPLRGEPQNLVLKAAYALRAAAEQPDLTAAITLKKSLPVASGLGGGSSDAAAALRALNRFWDLGFSTRQLAEIGTVVGADVPACVHARPLRMTGIGQHITPLLAWPSLYGVIAHPGAALSTASVFRAFDSGEVAPLETAPTPAAGDFASALERIRQGRNDLEASARALEPLINQTLDALRSLDGASLTRMSGSGASCFALFKTENAAHAGALALKAAHPQWTVEPVTFGGAA
jgi:4-diphosphocytidyl-2-C-methyl-D-erythritol kinase